MNTDIDELETRNGSGLPPPLPPDAPLEDVIAAINALAAAGKSHAFELICVRKAVQEMGTRIGTFCERIEEAVGYAKARDTDPAPPGDGT